MKHDPYEMTCAAPVKFSSVEEAEVWTCCSFRTGSSLIILQRLMMSHMHQNMHTKTNKKHLSDLQPVLLLQELKATVPGSLTFWCPVGGPEGLDPPEPSIRAALLVTLRVP